MKPLIGLTTYSPDERPGWLTPDLYIEAIAKAGGIPVLLPTAQTYFVDEWIKILHGVLFIGGGDIQPYLYGENVSGEHLYGISPVRDSGEFYFMQQLLRTDIPVFAVCRGMQVLNVVLGGTLYPHLPDVFGEQVLHRSAEGEGGPIRHLVNIDAGSRLCQLVGQQDMVISYHHQCIHQLGKGLKAVARAEDGVIEALELETKKNMIAVQWHPEMGYAELPTQRTLFQCFVDDAREYQQSVFSAK